LAETVGIALLVVVAPANALAHDILEPLLDTFETLDYAALRVMPRKKVFRQPLRNRDAADRRTITRRRDVADASHARGDILAKILRAEFDVRTAAGEPRASFLVHVAEGVDNARVTRVFVRRHGR
jgi:hypothetical protein